MGENTTAVVGRGRQNEDERCRVVTLKKRIVYSLNKAN